MKTTPEVARELGVSIRRVRQLIKDDQLVATQYGRSWLIDEEDLARFKATRRKVGRPKKEQVAQETESGPEGEDQEPEAPRGAQLYEGLRALWDAYQADAPWTDDGSHMGLGWDDALDPDEQAYKLEMIAEERAVQDGCALDWANDIIRAVRALGGLRGSHAGASEYAELPVAVKNRNSFHTTDTLLVEFAAIFPQYWFADANDLHDALVRAAGIQVAHGIQAYGRGKTVVSKLAVLRKRDQRNGARREARALKKAA